jgi:hypothetical protein
LQPLGTKATLPEPATGTVLTTAKLLVSITAILLPTTRNTCELSGKKDMNPPTPPSERMSILVEVPMTFTTPSGTPGFAGQPTWL